MTRGTSLYLDQVRFIAALIVCLNHFGFLEPEIVNEFWRYHLQYLAQTAVDIFFVLSGYVIAYVTAMREKTLLEYSASRFGRLYSVVLPALLLTAASNYLVGLKDPNFGNPIYYDETALPPSYLGTLFFLMLCWVWPKA